VGCAVLFALHVALLSRWGRRFTIEPLLTWQLAVTAAAAFLVSPVESAQFDPSPRLITALVITGILATAVTTWLQLRYQPQVNATETALLYATEPAFAALFSWVAIGETMSKAAMMGGVLIVAGAVLGEWGDAATRRR
jgi:drug/metabolite transporter (DMT)-like permease